MKISNQLRTMLVLKFWRRTLTPILMLVIAAGLIAALQRGPTGEVKAAFFATRLVAPGGADSGDCTGAPCLTITYAIGQASAGDTVSVAAGTYTENLAINKRITLDGAGSGAGAGDTIIQSGVIDTPVVNYSVGGADAVNRQVIKDVRLQNATSASVGATVASGILFVTSAPSGFLTIDNVVSTNNVGHGLVFNNGGGNNITDVDIINSTFSNNRTGFLIRGGPYTVDGLDVSGSQFNGNDQIGMSFNPNGTVGLAGTNFTFLNTTFTQNGDTSYNQPASPTPGLGFGDLSLFGFNGNASLTNVTVNGLPTNGAHIGVQFRGTNTVGPAGTISLNNVTITGSYVRPINHATLPGGPGGGLFIQNYTDVSNFSFNDVDLLANEGHQLFVAGVTNTLNVGDAEFGATLGAGGEHIALGTTTQNPGTLSPVNATGATFGGILASTATLAQLSIIEDNILHGVDVVGLGLVRVRAGNVYVTPNSFFAPATTTPSIQRGIDSAIGGDTVNVAAGTYTETIGINKSLTLLGAQAGVNACGRSATESTITAGAGTLLTLQTGSAGAIINGFTFSGGARGIESSSGPLDNLQLLNNRIIAFTNNGIFLNDPGTDITVHQNSIDGASKTGTGGLFHLDTDTFNGFHFTSNCITGKGATDTSTGFFVDGNHNVSASATPRNPMISENTITACNTGMNLGTRAFGSLTVPNTGIISNNTFSGSNFDGLQGGIQNTTISGNTFSGNGRFGVSLTSFGNTGVDRGGQNTAIKGNLVTGNGFAQSGAGIFFSGSQAVGTIETNSANFNRIIGNNVGIQYGSSVAAGNNATINVENNWWGCNFGPGATGAGCAGTANGTLVFAGNSGVLDSNPWLTLTPMAMPTNVPAGGASTLSAKLIINSDSVDTTAMAMFVPNGTPASFTQGTLGTVAPTSATTTNGVANTTYMAGGTLGNDSVSMTIDGQTVSQVLTVVAGLAAKLVFVQQPTTTPPNFTITPAVTVQVQDAFNNNVMQAGISITLSLSSGAGALSGTLTQMTDASGVATFNNLSVDQPGTKQLTAMSGALTPAVSNNFTILPVPTVVYVDDNWVGTTMGADPDGGGPATIFGYDAFATVQGGVNGVASGGTVNVFPGTYIEDVSINRTMIVSGAGPASTTISGALGGPVGTVAIAASNVEFKNFKVTREGNALATWNDPNLNSAGITIQGQAITGANIHDNLITQNRTGVDINNSNGHNLHNNIITDNHTGMIFRNVTDNQTLVENEITLNRTVGIVFLNANTEPVQSALNSMFSNNNLSGNWYAQIVDRQIGTANGNPIPTPGTTNLKNFSGNWFGTNAPVITTANSAEPGYAVLIPVAFGGTATAPGGQPDIAGPASANFDYTPYLDIGTDTNVETTPGRGTYGFQGSFNVLNVIATNAQTGATGRIQEGVNLVDTGGTVKALAGSYTENTDVNKAVTLAGTPTINGTLTASVAGAIISPGFGPGIIQHGNLSLVAGSVYSAELASLAGPGTGHDHLDTVGTVSLGGATLSVTASFVPSSGNSFTIINNDGSDPVMGIFNGLPEGTVFLVGGTPMQISYAGGTNSNDVVLSVNCPLITVTPPTLPNGVAGVPYSQTISALPMGGGYTFAVTGGALPTGLTLMSNGTLSGTPMVDGPFTFTITATGFSPYACTGSQTYTLTIGCPAISLTPASLPNGTAGVAYSQTIGATPPGGNYTFALTSGTLPAGITLASNGTLSGSSTQTGTFNFRVTGTGFGVCSNFRDYQLTIECTTISVSPASLPGGTVGDAYSQTVSATPAGAYNYSVTSGAMPPGLSLNAATGAITGMPTTTGSFSFTVSATVGACVGSRNYTVTIACSTISFTTSSPLPAGSAGVAYSQMLNVTPAGSYTFSLVAGSLPGGLTLNPGTGLISGTPATTGTSTFTVKAQGANGCSATQTYTLVIACPAITVNPATLPSGTIGTAYSQTVAASPAGGNYTYAVSSGTLPTGLNLNPSTGLLSGTPSANGSFTFTITATGWGGCTGGRSYTVTVGGGGGCPTVTLPASAPNGSVGQLYLKSVAASPVGVYNYTASGSLPPGVTLFNSIGLIFGFPIIPGSYTFTITATAGACSGSQTYTILIGAGFASSLTVFSDFDGDGKSDLSVFRGGVQDAGTWLVANSGDGQLQATPWGSSAAPYNDLAVSGDYDGDGKTDLAVFRRGGGQAGYWYIKRSSDGQVTRQQWGLGTDIPVPGDYDADGKTDIAVWRGSAGAWYILRSSDSGVDGIAWGAASAGDIPVPGDYDGDSKTDVAVFRRGDGHWYIKRSSDGSTVNMEWGVGTDVPVPGDYDGDSKTDLAVWRGSEGNWYIVESSSAALRTITLGSLAEGDAPVTADYDGDGRADAAIWRASTGMWTVKRSSDGGEVSKAHGQSGDIPIVAKRSN